MRKLGPLLCLALVIILAFWKVLFHPEFTLLTGSDMAAAYFPWFDIASHWFRKGIFLFWDPYVYAGKANMGEPQPGLFYPLNWIVMLLPSKTGGVSLDGLQALLILDYFLASLFTYLLARSLRLRRSGAILAAVAFALGGYTAQLYGYVNVLSGFVWMPATLLCFRNALLVQGWRRQARWIVGSGCALALSFLAGHHIPPIHTGLLLLLYSLFMMVLNWKQTSAAAKVRGLAALGMVPASAALLTVFQWLPSAEWARHVYRWVGEAPPAKWGEKVPYSILQGTSNLSPQDAISLLLPYVSTNANIYVGGIVLFLALTGLLFERKREALFFGMGAFVYYFLSWGRFSALHGWLNTFVPGVWFAREVFYYLIPFQMCLALLAGWGLDHLVESYSRKPSRVLAVFVRRSAWMMALLVLCSGTLGAILYLYKGMPMGHPYVTALASLACYLGTLGLLLFFLHTGRVRPGTFALLVVGLALLDLTSHLSHDLRTKETPQGTENTYIRHFWKMPPIAERLAQLRQTEFFRVDDPSGLFPPNYGDVWRMEATMGHSATALVDYFTFRNTGWGPGSNATALLNTLYIPSRVSIQGMVRIYGNGAAIYRNPRAVPRAFVASRYRAFARREEILPWLRTPLFAPRETVLLQSSDLKRLKREFTKGIKSESEEFKVSVMYLQTSAEKSVALATDESTRRELTVYQAPWGWSKGDEITVGINPEAGSSRCFLILSYYPTTAASSRLNLKLDRQGLTSEIPVDLAGLDPSGVVSGKPLRRAVDLGALGPREHRLSLAVTESCSAHIDSLRVTGDPGPPGETEAGSVELTSFEPNRVRMTASIKNPAFVVLSEVYYPGWEATVDGQPVPILNGDYVLRAIPVQEGEHTVEVCFRPATFRWGLALSGIGFVMLAAMWMITRPPGGSS